MPFIRSLYVATKIPERDRSGGVQEVGTLRLVGTISANTGVCRPGAVVADLRRAYPISNKYSEIKGERREIVWNRTIQLLLSNLIGYAKLEEICRRGGHRHTSQLRYGTPTLFCGT